MTYDHWLCLAMMAVGATFTAPILAIEGYFGEAIQEGVLAFFGIR